MMNKSMLAQKIAEYFDFPKAEKYDAVYREFDNSWEIIGYIEDPNCDPEECKLEGVSIPKRWQTIGVVPSYVTIPINLM